MRIAFLVSGGLDRVSGGFVYDRNLVAGLRARGDEVTVHEVPLHGYPRALLAGLGRVPFSGDGHDVIIEDELGHPSFLRWNRRWRRAGTPVVALVHNLASRQPRTRLPKLVTACERAYLRGVDGIIAVCASTLSDVEACAAPWRKLLSVIAHPGADNLAPAPEGAALAARAREPGPLRALFVGTVGAHKGLHRLLPVLERLGRAVTLDVAGSLSADPRYVAQIKQALMVRGLMSSVRLRGELEAGALAALYRASHVLVLPSDREAYPLVALEAMGFGVPAVLTIAGGGAELLGEAAAYSARQVGPFDVGGAPPGVLLDPDDTEAWVSVLQRFSEDRDWLLVAGRAAIARVASHGVWNHTANRVHDFLAEVRADSREAKAKAGKPGQRPTRPH